ncbi:malonyl-CoA synthase [Arenicella sp. 4NH20-0111]|uniref:AMP-binding protein n=1 Tax=Arenicella sp. 4NH20-0111 TaxID=3127648 RepID=UPI003106F9C7
MTAEHNLYENFRNSFPENLDEPLLFDEGEKAYSYRDFETSSAKLANLLKNLGLKVGDRITVQVEKSPQSLSLYLACLRGGFVYHPLNTSYKSAELAYLVGDANPSLIVCDGSSETEFIRITSSANDDSLTDSDDSGIKILTLNDDGSGSLFRDVHRESHTHKTVDVSKTELAALLYSSGTTGKPKGIMLSHENLLTNARALVQAWGFSKSDCLLHMLPMYHVHGLFVGVGCALLSGARIHWYRKFDAGRAVRALPNCTVMMGVPTYYTRLLTRSEFSASDCSNMRLFISGSAPLLEETFVEFQALTGHTILERYGMTETGMNTSNPLSGERRAGTVGLALPGVEVRVVDQTLNRVSVGVTGDLQIKGPNVFIGYWQKPDKTKRDFTHDGYFDTGDKAQIDQDGYVSIVGRAKDMIITGGLNVYPKEVELVIDEIVGVVESAVVGIPDSDFGEAVVAVVVFSGRHFQCEEIVEHCRKNLAGFKVPKYVYQVDQLPRNAMGKVQKNTLRDTFANVE